MTGNIFGQWTKQQPMVMFQLKGRPAGGLRTTAKPTSYADVRQNFYDFAYCFPFRLMERNVSHQEFTKSGLYCLVDN